MTQPISHVDFPWTARGLAQTPGMFRAVDYEGSERQRDERSEHPTSGAMPMVISLQD
jgi:hypothetical protein